MIIEKILSVSNETLNNIEASFVENYDLYHNFNYFYGESGREHYRLLMYISSLYSNKILFDIGTNKCMSALALSYNKNNKIKTYDIIKLLPKNPERANIEYFIGDSTKDQDIKNTPFIFLDVAHDGIYENILYKFLQSIEWDGLLMLDDIHLNLEMKQFWDSIEYKKHDITKVGHWSGTGIVEFGKLNK
jgi:hypothetical protein